MTRSPRRAPCCSRASTTSPGTCRSRTRSWRAWRRAARARSSSRRAATSSISSSTSPTPGPRSTASARASRPSIRRSATRRCARPSRCWSTRIRSRSTSTAAPACHGELRQQPGALRLQDDQVRVQRRQGQRGPGEGGLEEGRRRHPREGRQEAQVRLPDLDQPAAPEDPGDRQAGRPEGRHRHRAEVGDGVGVLLVRRRQPGHLHQVLLRPADVHDDHVAAGPGGVHGPVRLVRGRHQGEQVAGPQHHALAEQGLRRQLQGRPVRGRPGQARRHVRRGQQHGDQQPRGHSRRRPPDGHRGGLKLNASISGWDNNTWDLSDWYKDA